jgi:HJR/Mrr/RecB family endonuclease
VLHALGAEEPRVIPRKKDKGADVVANFRIAWKFVVPVAVQVKQFRDKPPVSKEVVDDLVRGMEAEGTHYGLIVTSGTISEEAEQHAVSTMEEKGCHVAFIDGRDLASKIVDLGLNDLSLYRPKV